jgi:hypothetical protein
VSDVLTVEIEHVNCDALEVGPPSEQKSCVYAPLRYHAFVYMPSALSCLE